MQSLLQRFRYTFRLLLKSPGFTITAVLILGFGIGLNTAIFSLIETVIINVLPYPEADRLVKVSQSQANGNNGSGVAYPDYLDFLRTQRSFETLSVQFWDYMDLSDNKNPERFVGIFASASLFEVGNLPFLIGRAFTEDEDKSGGPLVVVLSENLWRNRFDSDPKIIGKSLILRGESFEVVGVCPRQAEDVSTDSNDRLYVPIHATERFGGNLTRRDLHLLYAIGRMKKGVTFAQAKADLKVTQDNLRIQFPEAEKGYSVGVGSLSELTVATYAATVSVLGGAAGGLLLISCSSVATLLFARALERRREMAIRAAVGASRFSLIYQLLSETTLLSVFGGIAGLGVALFAVAMIKRLGSDILQRFHEIELNPVALLFMIAVTAIVALLSGFLPALSLSKAKLGSLLKSEGERTGSSGPNRQRTQSMLVSGQIAIACILLIATGLLVRSFEAAQNLPLGFNPHHVLTARIYPTDKKYNGNDSLRNLFDAVFEKVRQMQGVTDAAMNAEKPFDWVFGESNLPFRVAGQSQTEPGREPTMCMQQISRNYFKTLQIPLLQGRDFNSDDRPDSRRVAIVDEALARGFFFGQDPIGKEIDDLGSWGGKKSWTIVGVVRNSRHNRPDNPSAPFQVYFPYSQRTDLYRQFLFLRTQGDPTLLIPELRKAIASIDPDIPVVDIANFDEFIADRYVTRKLGVLLVGTFSGAALFLSAVGLYGVLAYSVVQRRREIGIRIAVGAQSKNILWLVIRQGLKVVAIGLIGGIPAALVSVRLIDSVLYGITGSDPTTLGISMAILGCAAGLACLIPGLRATRIDPIKALRE
jgi:putative ABC transport system permease protein